MPIEIDDSKEQVLKTEITEALRRAGCSVQDLHEVGHGCPTLMVGYVSRDGFGNNILFEVKSVGGRLNKVEQGWHLAWRGQVATVYGVKEALAVVGISNER